MRKLVLHEIFEEKARSIPDEIAVVSGNDKISFGDLNRAANRLARVISGYGCQNTVLPFHIERSINSIVAILGIMKAGCGYIPMDSQVPQNRVSTIVKESGSNIIITDKINFEGGEALSIVIQEVLTDLSKADSDLNLNVNADDTAYTIFTSGSTGVPKGVMISHAAITSYTISVMEKLELPLAAQYAHISTLNADLGNTMLFPSLLGGSTLHLLGKHLFLDANSFAEYMAVNKIDCLKITPNHFKALLENENPVDAIPAQRLIFGGEGLPWDLVNRVKTLSKKVKVYNHYGPTEATVGVLAWEVDTASAGQTKFVPLGFPLSDMKIYIMNDNEVARDGEPGELMVSGISLANGYINRNDLTDERFVPNPFGKDYPYDKMYRTGDLVKRLPDGNIDFLGRIDFQVKIRGNRVELDEISKVIEKFDGISESVVLAKENQLYGFLVSSTVNVDIPSLKVYLKETLPEYMVPTYLTCLTEIPLNSNGKIDRAGLFALSQVKTSSHHSSHEFSSEHENQHSDTELKIINAWKEVLKNDLIRPEDTFYDLGGDSLTAISVIVKMKRLGLPKDLLQGMLQGLSVRELAEKIDQSSVSDAHKHLIRNDAIKSSLNINALRGIFVFLVIGAHWSGFVLDRLPLSITYAIDPFLSFFFNMGTPGFSIVYGLTVGYSLFGISQKDRKRFGVIQRNTQFLLGAGILVLSLLSILELFLNETELTTTIVASSFYSVLMFYFLASLTLPLWFRFFRRFSETTMPILLTSCILYISYPVIWDEINRLRPTGILELIKLVFCAKYSYFNLMGGAFLGLVLGIHLKQNPFGAKRFLSWGSLAIMLGLIIAYHVNSLYLLIEWPLPATYLWGWLIYWGVIMVFYKGIGRLLSHYNHAGKPLRGIIQFLSLTGLLAFPLYVGHELVTPVKGILEAVGIHNALALLIPMGIFLIIFYFLYRKMYDMNFHWKK